MHVSSTNATRQLNHFLRWTSFEERLPNEDDHILLISFVYHCQSFLISHEQSVKEGLFVIFDPGALFASSFSYYGFAH